MPEFFFFFESDRLSACPHRWPGGCTAWGKAEFAGCVQKSPDCRQAPSPPRALGSACPARLELVLVQGFLERKRRDRKMSVGELLPAAAGLAGLEFLCFWHRRLPAPLGSRRRQPRLLAVLDLRRWGCVDGS